MSKSPTIACLPLPLAKLSIVGIQLWRSLRSGPQCACSSEPSLTVRDRLPTCVAVAKALAFNEVARRLLSDNAWVLSPEPRRDNQTDSGIASYHSGLIPLEATLCWRARGVLCDVTVECGEVDIAIRQATSLVRGAYCYRSSSWCQGGRWLCGVFTTPLRNGRANGRALQSQLASRIQVRDAVRGS